MASGYINTIDKQNVAGNMASNRANRNARETRTSRSSGFGNTAFGNTMFGNTMFGKGDINIAGPQRLISTVLGGVLSIQGLFSGSLKGLLVAGVGGGLLYRGLTGHSGLFQRLGVNTARRSERRATGVPAGRGVRAEKTITINRAPEELYRFWRDFRNLPKMMSHVEAIEVQDDRRSHWIVRGPAGVRIEWDAEIIHEEENRLIGWRTLESADVSHAGSVHFKPAPGGRGTEMRVVLRFDPPGGKAGATVAQLFGQDPATEIEEDLRHFKQFMEAGEIPRACSPEHSVQA